jgi:hypothetical protein
MQPSSPSRRAVSASICSSSLPRQDRDSRAQSDRVGVRSAGSASRAERTLLQPDPDGPGRPDEGEPAQHAAPVAALVARGPGRGDQPLALVVAQRRVREPAALDDLPDGQQVARVHARPRPVTPPRPPPHAGPRIGTARANLEPTPVLRRSSRARHLRGPPSVGRGAPSTGLRPARHQDHGTGERCLSRGDRRPRGWTPAAGPSTVVPSHHGPITSGLEPDSPTGSPGTPDPAVRARRRP